MWQRFAGDHNLEVEGQLDEVWSDDERLYIDGTVGTGSRELDVRADLKLAFESVRRGDNLPLEDLPEVLGDLERTRAVLWLRMLAVRDRDICAGHVSPAMTVSEVARTLRFSRGHIYELVRTGALTATRLGRSVRIPAEALVQWQDAHRTRQVDEINSVSLPSSRDRPAGQAHQAGVGADPAAVRRPARRAQGHRGQVGDGRPGHAGSGRSADRAPRPKHQGQDASPSKAPIGKPTKAEETAEG